MPRYNDYPLLKCEAALQPLVATGKVDFHQKWTCKHCRSRQTMADKNILYTSGICEQCGKESAITNCNYLVIGSGAVLLKNMGGT
jgi:hypothetical protein